MLYQAQINALSDRIARLGADKETKEILKALLKMIETNSNRRR